MPTRRFTCACGSTFTRYQAPSKPAPKFCSKACATDAQRNPHRDPRSWARRPLTTKTTAQRGLDAEHQRRRAALLPYAYGKVCPFKPIDPKCPGLMLPGQELDLDHSTPRALGGKHGDRIVHRACNKRAGARLGAQLANRARRAIRR